ncbi:myo-inositol-1(or 4)-monophosphatase [Ruminiclostridium sufflavum DSM 19573]|uniref:Inositol-1-monophosphatase n=1 Tax=Ruminiclostridium sufflavum DSM 19573 TaxID=1121337 RepID=A0A318XRU2_9FIRM|nr:inositol monophosphatase family protein [Ruminiclostridium sufflavum]PYG90317.1 myo-inositol-1(or 4)-monophosphatase [Ruminiclostridium sufflavum DSM 19573]
MKTIEESIVEEAVKLVREAGKMLLSSMDDKKVFSKSGTANFVTEIDIRVQEKIIGGLKAILPESNIIAEETIGNEYSFGKYTWILDPVDGTTNLMYGFKYSAVALGLFAEGVPCAGIVYNPYLEEMFTAQKGKGAFVNNQKIRVTDNRLLKDSLLTFGTSPYDREKADETFRVTRNVFLKCRDVRRTGSAALDICNVAAGRSDGFYEMELQPWDYAGASIILEEAGGRITDWQGKRLSYLSKAAAIVTNGYIHDELIRAVI